MKRPNDFHNVNFDLCLLIEAWKLVIFQSGEMEPESAAMLGATSSFFYELICQSNQKETRDQQQLFWKNHAIQEFGDYEGDTSTSDWKELYGSTMTNHKNTLAKMLDITERISANSNEMKQQFADMNEQFEDINAQLAEINEQAADINNQLSGMNYMFQL